MSRSHRLFDLLQILRRHRGTVSGAVLAQESGVSLRTIRRDVLTLQAMGADIDAEAGVGYVLRPGFVLPPLSFTEEELHALVVGAEWVARQTDPQLAHAVSNALAKINGVLAPNMREALDNTSFYVGPTKCSAATGLDLAQCRQALREQRKMRITSMNQSGGTFELIIWPIMLGFEGTRRSVAGWCETEAAFRIFYCEHIVGAELMVDRYTRNRRTLVKEWRASDEYPCASSKVVLTAGASRN
ncbi:putative DNA-binding transcriptional regulator YafY [Sphingomonas sp. PP-F2F-A104-K0414]|uniref:helix-turn-helix transcriptional regulator n=1 Tax=Sphingomonas sp. PP-F2F-A104-K0414 TaxID=2135661 RepID=UPI0010504461|nr:YafY family protein [Sphingomonas sp. PP-F2F-A104-K0414]TCP97517.1 putative DNA-binding transcriptional regulator YafY [Sphingomonas sp. PP-F2F-A104-K0414]